MFTYVLAGFQLFVTFSLYSIITANKELFTIPTTSFFIDVPLIVRTDRKVGFYFFAEEICIIIP